MIIPCINSTSFGERGGSIALVEGGSVRVGWPGAPGWTITGFAGSACCAKVVIEKRQARAAAEHRRFRPTPKHFIGPESLSICVLPCNPTPAKLQATGKRLRKR